MRLIDADAMQVEWLAKGLDDRTYDTNDVLDSIDEQPTIDHEYKRPATYIVGEQVQTEHIKDYNRTIALMFEDMVDFADRYGFRRDEVVNSMIYDMHTLSGYCDMNRYRPMPR